MIEIAWWVGSFLERFVLYQWPFAFETCLFVHHLVGASKTREQGPTLSWFYSILLTQIVCHGGDSLSKLFMRKPSSLMFTNFHVLVPLGLLCWVLVNKCDIVYRYLKRPVVRELVVAIFEIHRSHRTLNIIDLANQQAYNGATREYYCLTTNPLVG
ncbi:unnamed protein product, partial [Heterosigma akashiwo]